MSDQLAINGGPKVREQPYPPWPVLSGRRGLCQVLRSGELTQLTGGAIAAFESFAAWHEVQHCA
jgi:hypothetical protein